MPPKGKKGKKKVVDNLKDSFADKLGMNGQDDDQNEDGTTNTQETPRSGDDTTPVSGRNQ
jgi:hypothetical protein